MVEMVVMVEVAIGGAVVEGGEAGGDLAETYQDILRRKIGVAVKVEITTPGALAAQTGIESRQKPIRLIDERN